MPLVDSARLVLRPRTNSTERGSEQTHRSYRNYCKSLSWSCFHSSGHVQATALTSQFYCLIKTNGSMQMTLVVNLPKKFHGESQKNTTIN